VPPVEHVPTTSTTVMDGPHPRNKILYHHWCWWKSAVDASRLFGSNPTAAARRAKANAHNAFSSHITKGPFSPRLLFILHAARATALLSFRP
jgi:hypothetical protein